MGEQTLGDQSVMNMLKERDILPTRQRCQIARVLFEHNQHLSADEVLARVNSEKEIVSKATVYNTLGLFARKKLVREVIVDPQRIFYDTNTSYHHHFYNVDTGVIQDIGSDELSIEALPVTPEGTEAVGVDVVIRIRNSEPASH